ncbi:hypothetical protein ASAP_0012 [Asaia bogorensis]|uniref:Uncharacterized protein n=1 Tax=Asaia bogorensis TaxID=91915 RepID=A0A060QGY8_9PROT|nr:hypothetical protein [Asaia bogorensis]CDG38057.1 hypothetical protein ASAP_0012 [Asaia bogorensis]
MGEPKGVGGLIQCAALLDLNEQDETVIRRYEIDLAIWGAASLGKKHEARIFERFARMSLCRHSGGESPAAAPLARGRHSLLRSNLAASTAK